MSDFSELETELKKLRPAPVPAKLLARVEHALAQPAAVPTAGLLPRRAKRSSAWWSLGLGLTTASALLLIWLAFFAEPPPARPIALTPRVAATSRNRPMS